MDNVFEISLLLDFYGQMLTKRQYEILDLHYNNDYSLGEISEQLSISRQGVFDNLKRSKTILNNMENKLGLVSKFLDHKNKARDIQSILKSIDCNRLLAEDREKLVKIQEGIDDIIKGI